MNHVFRAVRPNAPAECVMCGVVEGASAHPCAGLVNLSPVASPLVLVPAEPVEPIPSAMLRIMSSASARIVSLDEYDRMERELAVVREELAMLRPELERTRGQRDRAQLDANGYMDKADQLGQANARLVESRRNAVHRAEQLELRVEGLLGRVDTAEAERDAAVESQTDESLYVNDLIGGYAREHAIAETLARAVLERRADVMQWMATDILRPEAKAMFEGVKEKHGLRLTSWPVNMMAEYFVALLDSRPDAPNYATFFLKVPGKGPDDEPRELDILGQWRSGQTPSEVAEVAKQAARVAEAQRDEARAKLADMHTTLRETLLDIERRALACTSLLAKRADDYDRMRLRFKGAGYSHAAELLCADLARFEGVVFDIQVSRRESVDA